MFAKAVLLSALLLSLAAPFPAWAAGKGKQCFTDAELTAEREVRHGIYLRETSRLCQAGGFLKDSFPTWEKFEEVNGARFRAAVGRRAKAWKREFPQDWQSKQTRADGAIVTYARNLSMVGAVCAQVDKELKEISKGGYGKFSARAKLLKNEVSDDYKPCR
ncbi:hypothetical protein [Phaeospirillum tilakii]|uniref:Lysozyme inhibitor LprI N-terminal domain-containing protein n=1 Tax=Phaeospirillum tilakii TaxID=741673 RepID=A0ABW5CE23_9PROT